MWLHAAVRGSREALQEGDRLAPRPVHHHRFPCNQFGGQDPGSDDQIQEFCQLNYGVTFPVLGKTDVNGDKAEPVFKWLKSQKKSLMMERIKWNFEKFLIGKDGQVVERWASTAKPESLEPKILEELAKGAPAQSKV